MNVSHVNCMQVPHGYPSERNCSVYPKRICSGNKALDMRDVSYKIRWDSLTGEICTFVWLAVWSWSLDGLVQKGYTVSYKALLNG